MPLKDCIVTAARIVHADVIAVMAEKFRSCYQSNAYLTARNRFLLCSGLFVQRHRIRDVCSVIGLLLFLCSLQTEGVLAYESKRESPHLFYPQLV